MSSGGLDAALYGVVVVLAQGGGQVVGGAGAHGGGALASHGHTLEGMNVTASNVTAPKGLVRHVQHLLPRLF